MGVTIVGSNRNSRFFSLNGRKAASRACTIIAPADRVSGPSGHKRGCLGGG
jgi:hypothetical protein